MNDKKIKDIIIIIISIIVVIFLINYIFNDSVDTSSNTLNNSITDNPISTLSYDVTSNIANIKVISQTYSGNKGTTAYIKIKGKPNTSYSIKVKYDSGNSKASGLIIKTSDNSGYVNWSWTIGTRTNSGTYPIIIQGGGDTITAYFTVN